MSDYTPVNVDAARTIGQQFEKDIVVIVSYDDKHETVHTTTWGSTPELKTAAGRLGEQCCTAFGGHPDTSLRKYFENFEATPAAEAAMVIDKLKARVSELERHHWPTHGAGFIAAERSRQFMRKGYDTLHDDEHTDGSLLVAGILIACGVADLELTVGPPDLNGPWPDQLAMHVAAKYGDDHIRRLTIAGAMIAAEIDRLQRAKATSA